MAVEWTQDLATGVEWQDNQHKELFARINNLTEAMKAGRGRYEVGKVLKFLEDYVISHFGEEEKYMNILNYPDNIPHKMEHTKFKNIFSDLKKQIESSEESIASLSILTIKVNQALDDWLKNHIGKVDKSLGAFLKTKK
jgi:hemerythrin